MAQTIYLDECGYTGDDLIDVEQPTFAIATHSFAEEESAGLKQRFFGRVQAPELKHSSLQRNARNQRAIVDFLQFAAQEVGRVRVMVADKRFALTAKLVDFIVEPPMHRHGLNLYEQGGHAAFSNLVFAVLQVEGATVLDQLLKRFQDMIRTRTDEAVGEFAKFLAVRHETSVIDEVLDMIRSSFAQLEPDDITTLPPRALDLSFTMALSAIYVWRQAGCTDMDVVHDESTNMARQKALWDGILSPTAPPSRIGYGPPEGQIQFPVGVRSTTFESSSKSAALQLADVFAGAVARWSRWVVRGSSASDAYGTALDALFTIHGDSFVKLLIWPTGSVERKEATPAGVGDPLEYLTQRVRDVGVPNA